MDNKIKKAFCFAVYPFLVSREILDPQSRDILDHIEICERDDLEYFTVPVMPFNKIIQEEVVVERKEKLGDMTFPVGVESLIGYNL